MYEETAWSNRKTRAEVINDELLNSSPPGCFEFAEKFLAAE
jgi:hypothetical protein